MKRKIILIMIVLFLYVQIGFGRSWQRFTDIDTSFDETLVLDNHNSYQTEFEDHVFKAGTVINSSYEIEAPYTALPMTYNGAWRKSAYISSIKIKAYWDLESESYDILYDYTGVYPNSISKNIAFTIPASAITGEPSFYGAHTMKLYLEVIYIGRYENESSTFPTTFTNTIVTQDALAFDYYMFNDTANEFYVDNLDPSNPSIVNQLKHSNMIAKWNATTSWKEPIFMIEGFDPKNNNFPAIYYKSGELLFDRARNEGRDAYILNFAEGGNTMATSRNLDPNMYTCTYTYVADDEVVEYGNASVVQDAVKFVSSLHSKNVDIAGVSMGGVVCRYALSAAEHVNDPLPVSHFLSIDSPQQYATIDYDLMDFVFTEPIVQSGLKERYSDLPYDERPSLLCYHATLELLWNNPASQYDISGSKDASIVAPSKNHNEFYKQLNALNGENRGYPSMCRNLGVSFSTYDGSLLDDYQDKTWLTAEIEAHGDVTFDYTFGSMEEHIDYEGSVNLIEQYYNKRILYAGSRLPLHYTNINVVDENYSMSKSMLMGMLSFDSDIVVRVDTDTKVQPTFIPFVSALDLYDPTFRDSEDKPFLYPQSTYLFTGVSMTSDNSFNFLYAGNQTNFPDPLTQRNYEDDTGTYWPQSTETGEEDFIGVRSRFDQILFNRNPDEYGTDHDVFPVDYIDGIFNFINDRVIEDITTWNNTWKNRAEITRDVNVNDKNTLYINNGINNEIDICNMYGSNGQYGNLYIKNGGTVIIEDDITLNIKNNVHIIFEPGSTLIIGNNCNIILNNLSYLVINENVTLDFKGTYDIKTTGYEARFIWKSTEVE